MPHKKKINYLAKHKPFVISSPFLKIGKSRKKKFGKITDMKRKKIEGIPPYYAWHGISKVENGYLLLNGQDMEIAYVSMDYELISKHSIVWDLIRPPRDRGGEATHYDIRSFRKKYRNAMHKTEGVRYFAMTPDYETKNKYFYWVGSRLKGFPLLHMKCDKKLPSRCEIIRACQMKGKFKVKDNNTSGLAYLKKDSLIATLEPKSHKVHFFKKHSCQNISYFKSKTFPKRIKEIQGISFDEDSNLWITSKFPDDYYNASVFYWSEKTWK